GPREVGAAVDGDGGDVAGRRRDGTGPLPSLVEDPRRIAGGIVGDRDSPSALKVLNPREPVVRAERANDGAAGIAVRISGRLGAGQCSARPSFRPGLQPLAGRQKLE